MEQVSESFCWAMREAVGFSNYFATGRTECLTFKGRWMFVNWDCRREWVDVVTLDLKRKKRVYKLYGYDSNRRRWSYGQAPTDTLELKRFLDDWMKAQ